MIRGLRQGVAAFAALAALTSIGFVAIPASAQESPRFVLDSSSQTTQRPSQDTQPSQPATGDNGSATYKSAASDTNAVDVTSPNGSIAAAVTAQNGILGYTATLNGKEVVKSSRLGLTVDGIDWGTQINLGNAQPIKGDGTRYPLLGVKNSGVDSYNGAIIPLVRNDGANLVSIEIRAYDTGIAVRYVLDKSLAGKQVNGEDTTFSFDSSSTIAYQEVKPDSIDDLQGVSSLSSIAQMGNKDITVLPTIEAADGSSYANITEANIRNWPGMALHAKSDGTFTPYYWATDNGQGTFDVSPDTLHSPFRVITIADSLDTLVNSDVITAVNDPIDQSVFPNGDTSWIKPGTATWTTIAADNDQTYDTIAKYVDNSAASGIDYVLIEGRLEDASWGATTQEKFAKLAELAKKGKAESHPVGIWLWMDYNGPAGVDDGYLNGIDYSSGSRYPRNSLQNPDFRTAYLKTVADSGVVGIKIDHFNEETETKTNLYGDLLKEAAKDHLMVEFHNPLEPTGLNRTYPNEVGREAIRGLQYQYDATEDTILPFTRYVAGTADYTPLSLTKKGGQVTTAHQIASLVGYTNPYLQISEDPANIADGGAYHNLLADLIASIPTVWKSSHVLADSKLGERSAVVRQSDDGEYWIAIMNGQNAAKVDVPLNFLPAGTTYHADIYSDRTEVNAMNAVSHTVSDVSSATTLTADLKAKGGYLARITTKPVNDPQQSNHYAIAKESDLEQIAKHPDGTFDFTADISMTKSWTPVETFSGTINGNGHVISNLVVADRNVNGNHSKAFIIDNQGSISRLAFSHAVSLRSGAYAQKDRVAVVAVTNNGVIDQVAVTGARAEGGWRTGIITAENYTSITNSYVSGAEVRANWETGGLVAWNNATGTVTDNYVTGVTAICDVQNGGVLSGYGYQGTVFTGNVVLSGSITTANKTNRGRINGQEKNGVPTYKDNYSLNTVTVDGEIVTDGKPDNKNGGDKTADELAQRSFYEGIGWDFADAWTWNDSMRRPTLKVAPNLPDAKIPGPARPQGDKLSQLLSGYDRYWDYYGDAPGVVDSGKDVLQHDDETTEAINGQAAKDRADDSSPAKDQQVRAFSDAQMNVTDTLCDALGDTLCGYFKDGMGNGSLKETSDFLGAMNVDAGTAKSYFQHPRPYVNREDFNGRTLDLDGLKTTLDISRVPEYEAQNQYTGLANSGSFPSGHTTFAYSKGTGLAYLLPELGPEIMARASEAGNNRIVLGVHYPLDIMGGRIAGQWGVADALSDSGRHDQATRAREELVNYLVARCKADGHGDTLAACIASTGANDGNGYRNAFIDTVSTKPVTDRVSAINAFKARMTYGFHSTDAKSKDPVVPEEAIGLLDNVEAFSNLTHDQKKQILALTESDSGYPLDSSSDGWDRIDLAAAYSAEVILDADGNVTAVIDGQPVASVVRTDHTAIKAVIAMAEQIKPDGYTADSWKRFADALDAAKAVDTRVDASQTELDTAMQKLIDAVGALERKPVQPTVNKSTLKSVLAQARAIDLNGYTDDSAEAVRNAIAAAEAVIENESATQKEVDQAAANLLRAVAGLVIKTATAPGGHDGSGDDHQGSGNHNGSGNGGQGTSPTQRPGDQHGNGPVKGNGTSNGGNASDSGTARLSDTGASSIMAIMVMTLLLSIGAALAMLVKIDRNGKR